MGGGASVDPRSTGPCRSAIGSAWPILWTADFPMLPSNGVCVEYWHDLPWAINQRALLEATLEVDDEDMVVEVQSSAGGGAAEGDIVLPFTSD